MIVPKTQKVKIEASSNSMIGYIPIYDPDISKLANEMYEEDLYDLNYFDNYKLIASKDIDTLNIADNVQALGIILFSFKFSQYTSGESDDNLDNY